MVRVKICGITNIDDALAAVNSGANALGFLFAPSPRQLDPCQAEKIVEALPPWISPVGVFVNEKKNRIIQIASQCRLDWIQLHGEETPEYCHELRAEGLKLVKVLRPREPKDLEIIPQFPAAAIHLDTYNKEIAGGTGEVFSWDLALEAKKYAKPVILAGGLNPDNVVKAIKKVFPYAVDVSSGVEKSPGKKDPEKKQRFIKRVNAIVRRK